MDEHKGCAGLAGVKAGRRPLAWRYLCQTRHSRRLRVHLRSAACSYDSDEAGRRSAWAGRRGAWVGTSANYPLSSSGCDAQASLGPTLPCRYAPGLQIVVCGARRGGVVSASNAKLRSQRMERSGQGPQERSICAAGGAAGGLWAKGCTSSLGLGAKSHVGKR